MKRDIMKTTARIIAILLIIWISYRACSHKNEPVAEYYYLNDPYWSGTLVKRHGDTIIKSPAGIWYLYHQVGEYMVVTRLEQGQNNQFYSTRGH